eukprot:CAMPEP_0168559416 /NCGR_PEP_ID=MMETSP0413-20121227/10511_1 /TAXON_ID=136452 /ORGANISM="Filamoeba nolandi, Strain NC-AS-23-1" /LENGTH=121 /DNA_ID=CAMNT_0008590641 /DNA_START=73 /DNA_END=438 /DNA_ORIENTATION=+
MTDFEGTEDPLIAYRIKHEQLLEEKNKEAQEKRDKMLEDARAAIDAFYQKRAETKEKTHAANLKNEQKFVEERDAVILSTSKEKEANAQAWANVATLIDFKAPAVGRDTARMKKLLIELKH